MKTIMETNQIRTLGWITNQITALDMMIHYMMMSQNVTLTFITLVHMETLILTSHVMTHWPPLMKIFPQARLGRKEVTPPVALLGLTGVAVTTHLTLALPVEQSMRLWMCQPPALGVTAEGTAAGEGDPAISVVAVDMIAGEGEDLAVAPTVARLVAPVMINMTIVIIRAHNNP